MPLYEYQGQQYDIDTDDHSVAKEKILAHLAKSKQPESSLVDKLNIEGEGFDTAAKSAIYDASRNIALGTVGLPSMGIDKLVQYATGNEDYSNPVTKYVGGLVDTSEQAKQDSIEKAKASQLGGVGSTLGTVVGKIPEMVMGGTGSTGMKTTEEVAGQLLPSIQQMAQKGFAAAQPMAVNAGLGKYESALDRGHTGLEATAAGLGGYGNMAIQGTLPMGMPGSIGKRVASGAAVNVPAGMAGRQLENLTSPTDMQQNVFDPKAMATDALIGSVMHGVMGHNNTITHGSPDAKSGKPLPRNVDAELIQRAKVNSERQLDALILVRKQLESEIEAGNNTQETTQAYQEVSAQIEHVTKSLENAIADLSGHENPINIEKGAGINKVAEARQRAKDIANLMRGEDGDIPTIPVKKGALGPDEVAPVRTDVMEGPTKHVGEFDPETGEFVKEGVLPIQESQSAVQKQTPMEVAIDRIKQVIANPEKLDKFREGAQAMLDDLPNRVARDDTPGSHYSALKEALEAELAYYNKEKLPAAETKADFPEVREPKGMGIDVFKDINRLAEQLRATDVPIDKLKYYSKWAKDGMARLDGFGEGQRGYDPNHDYTITWENLKKVSEHLDDLIKQKEEAAYKESETTGTEGPKTYNSMAELLSATKDGTPSQMANQRRIAMENNPQLFTTPAGTTVKFSIEIPKMLRDIMVHFMKIAKMDQDSMFVTYDHFLHREGPGGEKSPVRGRMTFAENKGIMYLNPQGIAEHSAWMSTHPALKTMFNSGKMKTVMDNIQLARYAAHEMGHYLFNKYLYNSVTHINDLVHIQTRWREYLKNNKLTAISVFDIDKPGFRAEYQKAFHEFFAEQVAKEMLHKHLVDKFTFGKGKEAIKYMDQLKRIVYHSAKYVEGLVGKAVEKDNFAKDILNDIMTGNQDFIKQISKQSAERLEMKYYNDKIMGEIKADRDAFPFFDDSTDRFVLTTASGDKIRPGTMEHTRYLTNEFEGIVPEKAADGADTGAKYPNELDIPNYDAAPLNLRTARGLGSGFVKNFFAKQTVRKIFQSDPLIRKVNDIIRNAERRASSAHSWMLYEMPSFKEWKEQGFVARMSKMKMEASVFFQLQKTSNKDAGVVHDLFMKGFDESLPYNVNLKTNGGHLTPKQVKLYDTLSRLFKKQFDIIKEAEKDLDKRDKLQYREGWYPAVRNGKYAVTLRYNGNAVHVENFRSKVEANLFLQSLKKGGSTKIQADPIVERGDGEQLSQFIDGVTKAQDIIANMFPNAGDTVRKTIQQTLTNMQGGGVGVHNKFRSGMKGYRGSELFGLPEERGNSFRRAIQDSMNEYAAGVKSMYVMNDLKDILHSEEAKAKNNPDSQAVAEQMVASALNRVDSKAFSSLDKFVRETWDTAMSHYKGELKQDGSDSFDAYYNRTLEMFYMTKLLGKPLFAINQVITSLQAVRELSYDAGFLGPYAAMAKGIGRLMTGHRELQQVLYAVSTNYHTFEPQFMEALHLNEDGSNPSGVVWNNIKKYVFLNKLSEVGDSLSRVISFSAAYSMYRDAGKDTTTAMHKAMEVADQSMGLTGRSETPAMFTKMGLVGQGVKPLQMFAQNALGNFVADVKYAKIKNIKTWAPLVNNILVMAATGGIQGTIFATEYEIIRLFLEKHAPEFAPPSLLELFKVNPDMAKDMEIDPVMVNKAMQYGLGSLTGIDALSSMRANETFLTLAGSVITGQEAWYKMFPAVSFSVDVAKGAKTFGQLGLSSVGVGKKPSNAEIRQAASSALPSGPISYGVKDALGANEAQVAGVGTGMLAAGKENQGVTPMTTTDKVAGYLGTRGTDEKYVSGVTRLMQEKEMTRKEQVKSLYVRAMETKPFESDGKTPNKDFVAIMKKLVEKQQTADQIASNLQGEAYKRASSLAIRSIINKNGEFSENPETFRKANLLKNFGILKEGRN